jgi:diaminohydroxyphosphoribosylaminopyrimidine deaminase / 5-amino-6-(5-phosphoribosylamino)uracil reductase
MGWGSVPRVTDPHLRAALRLAARGRYRAAPNPRVGSIVLDAGGEIVGRGYHRAAGEAHAEAVALGEAGERARGGTLYVTLEPCAHHGRTPPCLDAVLASGVRRVVACHADPDPRTSGRSFQRLRGAGIEVETGGLAREAVELNLGFLIDHLLERPLVTLKWAMSLDGKIATASGESRWISSAAGRRWALGLREEHDALLVGSGTVLADDPALDRRLGWAGAPNTRVVLDRRLRVEARARVFEVSGRILLYTESTDGARRAALAERGAEIVVLPVVEPRPVLGDLHRRGIQSVLVEGGGEVLGAFVAADLFDRVEVCCAPLLIGGENAPGPVRGAGVAALVSAPRLESVSIGRRGPDVIVSGVRAGRVDELVAALPGR